MSNRFIGRGNLGADPEFKVVDVGDERRPLATFNLRIDRWVPKPDNTFEEKGGFWLTINLWGPKAESARLILQKGARVRVEGRLVQDTWREPSTGIAQSRWVLLADQVDLDLTRLQSVTFKPKEDKSASSALDDSAMDHTDEADFDDNASEELGSVSQAI